MARVARLGLCGSCLLFFLLKPWFQGKAKGKLILSFFFVRGGGCGVCFISQGFQGKPRENQGKTLLVFFAFFHRGFKKNQATTLFFPNS